MSGLIVRPGQLWMHWSSAEDVRLIRGRPDYVVLVMAPASHHLIEHGHWRTRVIVDICGTLRHVPDDGIDYIEGPLWELISDS